MNTFYEILAKIGKSESNSEKIRKKKNQQIEV